MLLRAVVFLGVVVVATPAFAGRLGQVVGGVRQQTGAASSGGGGSKGGTSYPGDTQTTRDHRAQREREVRVEATQGCLGCFVYGGGMGVAASPEPPAGPLQPGARPRLDAYAGIQSVVESDFSGSVHVRGHVGFIGLEAGATTFVEEVPKGAGTEYLRLDLWNVGTVVRLLGPGAGVARAPEVFASLGLTGMSTVDVNLLGVHAGLDARIPVAGEIDLIGSAGVRLYEDDIRAMDARAGVSLSFFQVSYRVTEFNTGPPLHGPEVGLQWRY